ncbi:hypothetical protein ABE85_22410 [Mitsuaria sp. 7]|nr:hypothetical protein ABE85_22410 [Mitsuaria sp. 7]
MLSACFGSASAAAPEPFACPAQLASTDQSLASVPVGWEATTAGSDRTQHQLTGFAVNGGPAGSPDGEIYDKMEERKDGKGGATQTLRWNLEGFSEGRIAVCSYFRTRVELVRPLDGYSSCEVVYKRSKNGAFQMASASCR